MDEKQLFDFEIACPPIVTRKSLQAEQERKRVQRQTACLVAAAFLVELCLLTAALLVWDISMWLSVLCMAYVICSSAGGGILAVFCNVKRREIKWQA